MSKKIVRVKEGPANGTSILVLAMALLGLLPVEAEGLRNIASITVDNWFDGTWRTEVEEVFLAKVLPALTLQAKAARADSDGWYQHFFHAGPVVSFADTLYLVTAYGVGIDSESVLSHEAELDFNYETADAAVSMGLRAHYLPDSEYAFLVPSMSARIQPVERLGLFSKLFVSVDSDREVTGSCWGEADYAFSSLVKARAGFTVSYANGLGYSIISGVNLSFTKEVMLKYTFSYLSETVDYVTRPEPKRGIENALILDLRF